MSYPSCIDRIAQNCVWLHSFLTQHPGPGLICVMVDCTAPRQYITLSHHKAGPTHPAPPRPAPALALLEQGSNNPPVLSPSDTSTGLVLSAIKTCGYAQTNKKRFLELFRTTGDMEFHGIYGYGELPFWYCQFLADAHIAKEPEDQWQFWLWSGGGAAYMVHSFRKAHALMKAKAPTTSPEIANELRALWDQTDSQMKKADYYARHCTGRARGVSGMGANAQERRLQLKRGRASSVVGPYWRASSASSRENGMATYDGKWMVTLDAAAVAAVGRVRQGQAGTGAGKGKQENAGQGAWVAQWELLVEGGGQQGGRWVGAGWVVLGQAQAQALAQDQALAQPQEPSPFSESGAFAIEPWRGNPRFFGAGETRVFQIEPRSVSNTACTSLSKFPHHSYFYRHRHRYRHTCRRAVYCWQPPRSRGGEGKPTSNDYFQFAMPEGLGVGDGQRPAGGQQRAVLDLRLLCLAAAPEFHICAIELWQASSTDRTVTRRCPDECSTEHAFARPYFAKEADDIPSPHALLTKATSKVRDGLFAAGDEMVGK
ncbi:hypothetical protein QJQ45_019424 [Haematococcus lacustris]|nr:hypothetical protein QJQ45_019424 [Haematococcus lacustris]